MAHTHRQTDKQTHGHGDSMTDPAQRAESVKNIFGQPKCPGVTQLTFYYIKQTVWQLPKLRQA